VIILTCVLWSPFLYSQWTPAIAPKIGPGYSFRGASCHSDGVTWIGEEILLMSLDSGLTWQNRSPLTGDPIQDIYFLDKMNGVMVSAINRITYITITSDQGISWRTVNCTPTPQKFSAAAFIDTPNNIVVASENGNVFCSNDAGNSWVELQLSEVCFDIVTVGNGNAYISTGFSNSKNGQLYKTTDYGRTWNKTIGIFDWDSYQFVQDQCDENIFYVANEDFAASKDGLSSIYVTTNSGTFWNKTDSYPITHHCGSITTSKNAVFAQTTGGIIRSADKGKIWVDIGGPGHRIDTRLVCAITNNIILAVDTTGEIWRTSNSGGFFIPDATTDELTWFPIIGFDSDTLSLCDSMLLDTILVCPTCDRVKILDARITGTESQDYSVISLSQSASFCDTLIVGFKPSHVGSASAFYELTLASGNVYTIPLQGKGVPGDTKITSTPATLFRGDTVSLCDTTLLRTAYITSSSNCGALGISKSMIGGLYAGEYAIISPLPLRLSGYDSLTIGFTPKGSGLRDAVISLELEDGTLLLIPLAGTGLVPKPEILFDQTSLFTSDTVCLADSSASTLRLSVNYCKQIMITDQVLQGSNKADYRIKRFLPDTINGGGDIEIVFTPTGQGLRDAEIFIAFDDGSYYTIPLRGWSFPRSVVSIEVGDASNDTLGGVVKIPFTFNGLQTSEDVTFSVTYDNSLEFVNVLSPQDVPIGQVINSVNWSKVTIPSNNVLLNTPTGYMVFRVFSDSGPIHYVRFDSLSILSSKRNCLNIAPTLALATVTSLKGCEAIIVSRFLRTNKIPSFTIIPNPAQTELSLLPGASVKNTTVEIVDVLGNCVYSSKTDWTHGIRKPINISHLAEGMYFIRIFMTDGCFQRLFAVKR
jgi:photosystem II stability/assembly factor-like uncharacterized protein